MRADLSERPHGLRERNRIRTREDILIAISLLLGERTYDGISIDDIAQRAGVARGTLYAYFPEGRDQMVREAYLRVAEAVIAEGSARHEREAGVAERVVGFATALVDAATTPEGRFYGLMGPDIMSAIASVTGTSSQTFQQVLTTDLRDAAERGALPEDSPVEEIAVALSGAVREIGGAAARDPERVPRLLLALRIICDALLGSLA
ncbi:MULTISPECIES: TetR/AcrR family transcriptional regulator [unclassified Mycolicibacterium]|uniref:TetR/AcrR family transcriptional regulator n=1 Tax=unclassified Mycolicibacterium TaxID=2636767 RepID=UPI0012DF79C0|nr:MULTISPECIES: TetR/AcrR family transcriptional regulator [unclassified Mycolicibacterium]MUL82974.1 TetR/AcrR family transcriptional regulator [Mycolicibacterium sp. CBMA 329]MUL89309.1 TetR/AcrR family transcriptional regulator [Mycolicibacterium sp. CBMA 331]MUM02776.1 TetR/AcrR family transcriptional regulator [Mycolicibacterium sp. CBMA 334]MUM25704.1 TetR/AcrR family transcriptional regulator [Mycolicibacterium sp. CBMA 295]MUM38825.1 TetR/AcrR family transcriptional regulator [Mycolic